MSEQVPTPPQNPQAVPSEPHDPQDPQDLGFGGPATPQSQLRFLNRDGTFNVRRRGIPLLQSITPYHLLLTMSWPTFLGLVSAVYFFINGFFCLLYYACGPDALHGSTTTGQSRLLDAFFFSVQTLSTIGYGGVSPHGIPANLLVTIQALVGLLFITIATGLIFARFSRPVCQILFSDHAIIAPYRDMTAFEFRIVNALKMQLLEIEARVLFSRSVAKAGGTEDIITELPLERASLTFFPLQWTVVHPIDENSPMRGLRMEDLRAADAEFIILLSGYDEISAEIVKTRSSYRYDEIIFGARFVNMYLPSEDGLTVVDMSKLHDVERVELRPEPSP